MADNTKEKKPLPSMKEVSRAADQVRRFWKVGHKSLQQHAKHYPTGANSQKRDDAKKLDQQRAAGMRWTPDKLRLARTFARHCPARDLEHYLQEAVDRGYAVGRDVMIRVFEVKNIAQRQRLWTQCLTNRLTKAKLLAARRRLLGGNLAEIKTFHKRLAPPRTPAEAMDMLQEAAARFQRVCDAVDHPDKATVARHEDLKPKLRDAALAALAKKNGNGSILSKLPHGQRQRVAEIRAAMEKFTKALDSRN